MGEAAEYEIWRRHGVDISDDGWCEKHVPRRGRAHAVRKKHGERLNAQQKEAQDWGPSGHPAFSNTPAQDAAKRKKARSNMKSKLELLNIAASVSEDLVTVRCLYNNGAKQYSFMCPVDLARTLDKDDWIVVSTKNDTFEVLRVAAVDNDCDLDDLTLNYQWVVGKVDTAMLDSMRKWHEAVGNDMHKQQRKAARKAMLDNMGFDGVAPLALTAGVSGDVIDAEDTPDTTQG